MYSELNRKTNYIEVCLSYLFAKWNKISAKLLFNPRAQEVKIEHVNRTRLNNAVMQDYIANILFTARNYKQK